MPGGVAGAPPIREAPYADWTGAVWVVEIGVRRSRPASITLRAQCLKASGNRGQSLCALLGFEVIYGSSARM